VVEEGEEGNGGASVVVGDPARGEKKALFLAFPKKLPNPLASCAAPVFATSTPARNVAPAVGCPAPPPPPGVEVELVETDATEEEEPSPPSFLGDPPPKLAIGSSFSLVGVPLPNPSPLARSLIAPCTPANHSPPALHPLDSLSLAGLRFAGSCCRPALSWESPSGRWERERCVGRWSWRPWTRRIPTSSIGLVLPSIGCLREK
jgi:hypothetical protein